MGRPRIFDEEQVVDHAMELFWTKGYEATSVSDLAAKLGVHPGSLYRTFGDKYVLFLRALARYRDSQARALARSLLAGGPVLLRIRAVLAGFIELTAEQDNPRGWLAANTVGELLPGDWQAYRASTPNPSGCGSPGSRWPRSRNGSRWTSSWEGTLRQRRNCRPCSPAIPCGRGSASC